MGKFIPKPLAKAARAIKDKLEQTTVRQWILAVLIFIGLFGILSINISPTGYKLEVGEVARQDIRVPRDMENRAQTERERQAAAARAEAEAKADPNYYIVNHATVVAAEEKLDEIFSIIAEARAQQAQAEENGEIDQSPFKPVDAAADCPESGNRSAGAGCGSAAGCRRTGLQHLCPGKPAGDHGTDAAANRPGGSEQCHGPDQGLDCSKRDQRPASGCSHAVAAQIIEPNLALDQQVLSKDAWKRWKRAPSMSRPGDHHQRRTVVEPEHVQMLKDLGLYREGIDYWSLLGLLGLVSLLLAIFGVALYKSRPEIIQSESRLAFVGSVLILVTLITKILSLIPWLPIMHLTPIALAGMLVTMLLDYRTGFLTVTFLAVVSGITFQSLPLVVQGFSGGLIAILSVSKVSQRGELMRAGFIVGASNVLVMITFGLLLRDSELLIHSYLGFLNGVICSVSTIGSLPYFESIFSITSAIRLLELTNPNHPLLKRLLMETPGTYHHSIIVGNLAEAAADAVGADGLLARVGATYHDIGKVKRPMFFVENQLGNDNPHDKIAPSLSTLIVMAHVKDGLELAREYKLPEVVAAFIAEHHGTDPVKFFYHRAQEHNGETVEEKDFRYPGPKPQTKETAIVSLADAGGRGPFVQTDSRQDRRPGPENHPRAVDDGQLDESDLTFSGFEQNRRCLLQGLDRHFPRPDRVSGEDHPRRHPGRKTEGRAEPDGTVCEQRQTCRTAGLIRWCVLKQAWRFWRGRPGRGGCHLCGQ